MSINGNQIFQKYNLDKPRCGISIDKGWMPIFEEFLQNVIKEGLDIKIEQVKQKFGDLRVYFSSTNYERVKEHLITAENKCSKTCEHCGAEAKKKNADGFMCVFCKECLVKWKNNREAFWRESDA